MVKKPSNNGAEIVIGDPVIITDERKKLEKLRYTFDQRINPLHFPKFLGK